MYTQCPDCDTIFIAHQEHLETEHGRVRCSYCHHVFPVRDHIINQLPEYLTALKTKPDLIKVVEIDNEELDEEETFEEEVLLEEEKKPLNWGSVIFWTLASTVLSGVLVAQYIWFEKPDLVLQDSRTRPWVQNLCSIAGCRLPITRNLNLIKVNHRTMTPHPIEIGAVQVDLMFINTATFPQPYPLVEVSFIDDSLDSVSAQRRFTPMEYLSEDKKYQLEMLPGEEVHVHIEVIDMEDIIEGDEIVSGFEFKFL